MKRIKSILIRLSSVENCRAVSASIFESGRNPKTLTAGTLVFAAVFASGFLVSTSARAFVAPANNYPTGKSITQEALLPADPTRANSIDANREARISALLRKMTLDEKVAMIGGTGFDTTPIPRLAIPSLKMTDGPIGVRNGPQTAFPAGIAMAATFDPALIGKVGVAMADEARLIGKSMLLGPCVGLSRQPFGGRNFESFGEDPFLTSRIAESYVKGVQGQGVLSSVKHFALNDQEYDRMTVDSHADMRTMFELHFPAYKAAIDAGSWTVMTSYNMVNGHHSTESDFLQNQVLKKLWGFQGFVVSDWDATHSTVAAANAGLDVEMPFGDFFGAQLVAAVKTGQVSVATVNDKVRRLMRAMDAIGILPGSKAPQTPLPLGPTSIEHANLARQAAEDSTVLLKNDGAVLPLDLNHVKTVALIGPSFAIARVNAGGSSKVTPEHVVTPLAAIEKLLAGRVKILKAVGVPLPDDSNPIPTEDFRTDLVSNVHGLSAEYFSNKTLSGMPFLSRVDPNIDFDFVSLNDSRMQNDFSVRWSGYLTAPMSGPVRLMSTSDDGIRVYLDDKIVIENWTDHDRMIDSKELTMTAGQVYKIRVEYYQAGEGATASLGWQVPAADMVQQAVNAASVADVAIVFSGLGNDVEGEGVDRETMDLPEGQADLIKRIARANLKTVLVLNSGNPVTMSDWLPEVPAILQAWYPGEEGGSAIANVLTGIVNPSAKLPVSFLKRWEDSPAFGHYPGVNGVVTYSEGIFLGYRFYDRARTDLNFPFGHGLSYTTFAYSDLAVKVIKADASAPVVQVEFTLTNTGARAGAEVPQVYVAEKAPPQPRPLRELKGFQKIMLQPGEARRVKFSLDAKAFAYFNAQKMAWAVPKDVYRIDIGTSSRDMKLGKLIQLN